MTFLFRAFSCGRVWACSTRVFTAYRLQNTLIFWPLWVSEMNLWVTKAKFLHALALSAQIFLSLLPSLSLSSCILSFPPHPSGFPICTTEPVNRRSPDRFTAAVPPLAASVTELI